MQVTIGGRGKIGKLGGRGKIGKLQGFYIL